MKAVSGDLYVVCEVRRPLLSMSMQEDNGFQWVVGANRRDVEQSQRGDDNGT